MNGMPDDIATIALEDVKARYKNLKTKAEKAYGQIPDEVWEQALSPEQNSIGVLVKHIAGNIRSRFTDFLTTDGEKPDRNRDSEFVLSEADTPEALRERWEASWAILFGELAALTPSDLTRTVMLRNKEMDALQALNNAHGHYAMHGGQIMMLGKYLTGDDWQVLSIPKGKSEEFFGRK